VLNCTKDGMNDFKTINDFTPDQFTPTQWDTAEKKAAFAHQFVRFVQADFAKSKFTKAFYVRLSMTFGHIAHYNQGGFFEEFFTTTEGKVRFLRMTLQHPCYGDAGWTYSDVERALQSWLRENGVMEKYEQRLADETEANERAALARLQAKYGVGPV
jgi:hypothetical protein